MRITRNLAPLCRETPEFLAGDERPRGYLRGERLMAT